MKGVDVRDDIRTTVEYLIKLLETEEFKNNKIDTSWLDGIIREKTVTLNIDPQKVVLSAAIYKSHQMLNSQLHEFKDALAKGQTSLQSINGFLAFNFDIIYDNTNYTFAVTTLGNDFYRLKINDQIKDVRIREQPDKSLLCNIFDESYQLFGQEKF